MNCPERDQYIANATTLLGLENLLNQAITEITGNLSSVAQSRGVQEELQLKRRSDGVILQTLPDRIRIWILQKRIWSQVFGPNARRGAYVPHGNKILLENGSWCRKTILHESLHSVSIFSDPCNSDMYDATRVFAEGVTEFMTGLLLYKRYGTCFESWRLARFPQWCSVSYPRETKTFLAFCACVNVQSLKDFYFGLETNDLLGAWISLTADIRRVTGKKFRDVFEEGQRYGLMIAFKNECERRFGKKFRTLQKILDYSTLP